MKVAFVLPCGGRAGGVRVTVVAANNLIERGHQVRILVYKPKIFSRSRLWNQWRKVRYPSTNDWLPLFKGPIDTFRDLVKCRFERGEIVIGSGLWACREITRLTTNCIKKVHYIHGAMLDYASFTLKEAWGEDVPKIAVASFLKKSVRDVCGQEVLEIIPNGIDTTEYFPSVPENRRNGIGTIFEGWPRKDPATILGVLKKLQEDCPQVPQRVFGPSPKPRELPSSLYVRLPSVDKARDIYSSSLVWFLGSRGEGFGCPILEAMACGCAVVATDCGGPRDMIKDGENGYLVEVGHVDEIADKVKLLLNNDELRCRIVERAKETVKSFNWEDSVDKLERFLHTVDSM
jgi:glycosyltransferase involved in cell wall biosynthesis